VKLVESSKKEGYESRPPFFSFEISGSTAPASWPLWKSLGVTQRKSFISFPDFRPVNAMPAPDSVVAGADLADNTSCRSV
jgi:hypothetical protein